MKLNFLNSKQPTLLSLKLPNSIWKGLSLLGCAKDSIRWPRGCQKFSKLTLHWVKSYSEKVHTYVTIMCHNDELSWAMSWVGCFLIDSALFILFAENSKILLKISVIPILLTFIYLVALNLLVNNQLNSSSNSTHHCAT